jgi:hypothetical protein
VGGRNLHLRGLIGLVADGQQASVGLSDIEGDVWDFSWVSIGLVDSDGLYSLAPAVPLTINFLEASVGIMDEDWRFTFCTFLDLFGLSMRGLGSSFFPTDCIVRPATLVARPPSARSEEICMIDRLERLSDGGWVSKKKYWATTSSSTSRELWERRHLGLGPRAQERALALLLQGL